jgi:biotin carboxyl carrier protein
MNYVATIGEREAKITVEELGGSNYKVTLDGREVVVDAHQVANRLWSVLYGFTSLEVDVTPVPGDAFEVLINGDCHKFSLMNEQRRAMIRAGGKGSAGKAMVSSPMPGKVVKLLVAEGQEVEAGQGVIVVEAMKMENELRSPKAGRVKDVAVTPGTSVEAGRVLVVIE